MAKTGKPQPKPANKPKPAAIPKEEVQEAEFDLGEKISSLDDEEDTEEIEEVEAEAPVAPVAETKPVAKKGNADGFVEKKGGNMIFEEWRGRISLIRDEFGEVIGKNFVPTERIHERRKMLQGEADNLNFASANTPHFSVTSMYLKPGTVTHGEGMNVNNIVRGAFHKKKKRVDG